MYALSSSCLQFVEVAPFPNPLGTDLFKSNLRWSVVGSSDHGLLSAGGQVQPVQQLRRGPASLMETGFGLHFFYAACPRIPGHF